MSQKQGKFRRPECQTEMHIPKGNCFTRSISYILFFSELQTISFSECVYKQSSRMFTMESFMRNLTKQVTCSICLETFKEPKIISCFRTFCCECLEKQARVSQRHRKFRCPECQAEIHLPEANRFEALPTSFFSQQFVEYPCRSTKWRWNKRHLWQL